MRRSSIRQLFFDRIQPALMFGKCWQQLVFPFIFGRWSQQILCRCSGVLRTYATPVQILHTIFRSAFSFQIFRGWNIRECFRNKWVYLLWAGWSIGVFYEFFRFWVVTIQVSVFVVNSELYFRRVPCRSQWAPRTFVFFLFFNVLVDVTKSFSFVRQLTLQ